MRRRTFIAGMGAAAAWPLAARADEPVHRIGILGPTAAVSDPSGRELEEGLRELGYVPGKTIVIEPRWVDGPFEAIVERAKELVALKVEVIVCAATWVAAARRATDSVPIVAAVAPPLVEMGFAESLSHPGGNVTGETVFVQELQVKRLALLKQAKPAIRRVGLLHLQDNEKTRSAFFDAYFSNQLRVLEGPAKALGVAIDVIEVVGPEDCDRALSSGPGTSIEGLLAIDSTTFVIGAGPTQIAAAAARHRLPLAGTTSIAKAGGLIGFSVDYVLMWRRAAYFVDKILKGTKPGDIPIEQATKFITVVNVKTAKALGLDIPPTLLAAADEVIE